MSIALGWSKRVERNEDGEQSKRNALKRFQQFERLSDVDRVELADGSVMLVRRASLAAAKDLLAAQKAAERRVAHHQKALRHLEELRASRV